MPHGKFILHSNYIPAGDQPEAIARLISGIDNGVIYAELSGDFPLGDSRQPTYKSLRPFDLVS